jgi:hypothetical protein
MKLRKVRPLVKTKTTTPAAMIIKALWIDKNRSLWVR